MQIQLSSRVYSEVLRFELTLGLPAASDAAGDAVGKAGAPADGVEAGHGGAFLDGGGRVLAHLAVGRQERGREECVGSSHDGHRHVPLGGVDVSGLVRLAQHPVHRRRKVVESELHV